MRCSALLAIVPLAVLGCYEFHDTNPIKPGCPAVWLWTGPRDQAASCPDGREILWEGWNQEIVPDACGPCSCGPTACVLPSAVTTHAPICGAGEENPIGFDAGAAWDGSCAAAAHAIPSGEFASVTYEPPTLAPCMPSETPEPLPITGTFARACAGYIGKPPPDFELCVITKKDGSCWEEYGYSIRREFTEVFEDNRTCTPCTCGGPSGGRCDAQVTLYMDAECGVAFDSALVSLAEQPLCQDVTAGPLAAMRAEPRQQQPGACSPSVSAVVGAVDSKKRVLCCTDPRETYSCPD
jgi:hypothetical protein